MLKHEQTSNELSTNQLLESLESMKPVYKNSSEALAASVRELEGLAQRRNLSLDALLSQAETDPSHDPELLHSLALSRKISFLKNQSK
jgi:hypothetical protein